MEEMHELVTVQQFERGLAIALGCWFLLCPLGGTVWGRWRGRLGEGVAKGLLLAIVSPLLWGLWRYYLWMVRWDPETGYVGLHKVWVLLANLLVFAAAGAVVGWALRRAWTAAERCGSYAKSGTPPQGSA